MTEVGDRGWLPGGRTLVRLEADGARVAGLVLGVWRQGCEMILGGRGWGMGYGRPRVWFE